MKHSSEYYQWYKDHGICVQCHQQDAAIGFVSCADCLYKDAQRKRSQRALKAQRSISNDYTARHRAAGLCLHCSNPAQPGKASCKACLLKARQRQRARYIYHPRRDGICRMCDKPAKDGFYYCDHHYPIMVEKAAHMRAINHGFDMSTLYR